MIEANEAEKLVIAQMSALKKEFEDLEKSGNAWVVREDADSSGVDQATTEQGDPVRASARGTGQKTSSEVSDSELQTRVKEALIHGNEEHDEHEKLESEDVEMSGVIIDEEERSKANAENTRVESRMREEAATNMGSGSADASQNSTRLMRRQCRKSK